MTDNLPRATERFMPKKHASILWDAVRQAHREIRDHLIAMSEKVEAGRLLREFLLQHNPPADIEVLRRYGHAHQTEQFACSLYNSTTGRFDIQVSVPLDRPIFVSDRCSAFTWGGPVYRAPYWGCKPEWWDNQASDEEKARIIASHTSHGPEIPEELNPFFSALADAHRIHRIEFAQITSWPAARKMETGLYPLWSEIADAWPDCFGAALHRRWANECAAS